MQNFFHIFRYNKNDNDKNSGFSLRLPTSTAKEYNGEFDNLFHQKGDTETKSIVEMTDASLV